MQTIGLAQAFQEVISKHKQVVYMRMRVPAYTSSSKPSCKLMQDLHIYMACLSLLEYLHKHMQAKGKHV